MDQTEADFRDTERRIEEPPDEPHPRWIEDDDRDSGIDDNLDADPDE